MKKIKLLFIYFLLLLAFYSCREKRKYLHGNLVFQDKDCSVSYNEVMIGCSCINHNCKFDTNIYIIEQFSNSPLKFEKYSKCFSLVLNIYGTRISLDSLYHLRCRNKDLRYIPGYNDGKYLIINNILFLQMEYLNFGINSSHPTDHIYYVKFDLKKKKLINFELIFED